MEEEEKALLGLNTVPGLGPAGLARMVASAGGAAALAREPRRWWGTLKNPPPCPAPSVLVHEGALQAEVVEQSGARVLTPGNPEWPDHLDHLAHPPPMLVIKGNAAALGPRPGIAVIGARACTPYGREQARRFGASLAVAGHRVVSGAARGIDQSAMRGAVDMGGTVLAVCGCGIDRVYPPEAAPLLEALLEEGGAVVTEFPCGMAPVPGNFPRRNRLIAALSQAVLVIQATVRSGSLNTVGWALELGREVFAVPGPVDSPVSRGPHKLLRDGATLAETPADLLASPTLDPRADTPLLKVLSEADASLDELALTLDKEPDTLLEEIATLEVEGRVMRRPGGIYHRCGPSAPD